MTLFTLDADTCVRDGLCAAECPLGCIETDPDGLPAPHVKTADYCIGCGHCMAVCPTGALRLARFARPAVPLADLAAPASPGQVERLLLERRSVRAFTDEVPACELLARLLDLTQYAPSGHNARSVRWVVARGRDRVRRVAVAVAEWMRREAAAGTGTASRLHLDGIVRRFDAGADMICRDAPVLAVACAPHQGVTPRIDGALATAWLDLAAHGAGLGGCWAGYVLLAADRDPGVRTVLGLAEDVDACGALLLGRPLRRYRAVPPRPDATVDWV